ncbi:MAG TPA: RNA polymerase sigma factor [Steroidobacteraceae bacterium]|nr:RNA polymerase sigma factor [Steroidobacteraceae bacterium]
MKDVHHSHSMSPSATPRTLVVCEHNDIDLVQAAREGDHRAYEQIMRRYNQRLYRLATGVLGDASEAQDVLQESYVRAFKLLVNFNGASLGAWLARIVRNEAIDRVRARNARGKLISLEADILNGEGDTASIDETAVSEHVRFDPETSLTHSHMKKILEQAIELLPTQFREVFVLRELEGLSIKETAEYLDIPAATVKTRDYRARAMLRERLDKRIDTATKEAFAFLGAQCDAIVANVLMRIKH